MITLILNRYLYHPVCTISDLATPCGGFKTLEPPWKDNAHNDSCIPLGVYGLRGYRSPKHGFVLMVHDVPFRELIELHAGNYPHNTKGCILVGMTTYMEQGVPCLRFSDDALAHLLDSLPENEWMGLVVQNARDAFVNSAARICDRDADYYRRKTAQPGGGGFIGAGTSGRADAEHVDPDVKPSDQE